MKKNAVKITIPAQRQWLGFMDGVVEEALRIMKLPLAERLNFAVHEAFINAMRAAEELAPSAGVTTVEVQLAVQDDWLEVRVLDEGPGMPAGWQEQKDSGECIWETSGRGLLFIRQYMDEIMSECMDDGRHAFIMRKQIKEEHSNEHQCGNK